MWRSGFVGQGRENKIDKYSRKSFGVVKWSGKSRDVVFWNVSYLE